MSATWPSMPGVFLDYPAPVIRNSEGGREMVMMRWGMPPPPRTPGDTRHQHTQYIIATLAHLAEAGASLLGAVQ